MASRKIQFGFSLSEIEAAKAQVVDWNRESGGWSPWRIETWTYRDGVAPDPADGTTMIDIRHRYQDDLLFTLCRFHGEVQLNSSDDQVDWSGDTIAAALAQVRAFSVAEVLAETA